MKEQILKLREEGKTYNEIQSIVGCSKSTISYHCGEGQVEKTNNRNKKYKQTILGALTIKLNRVFKRKVHDNLKYKSYLIKGTFKYDKSGQEEFINKCISNPVCYLTNTPINLSNSKEYELDHIIPVSKGGSNTFDNLGLCLRDVNRVKADLLLEDLYLICEKLLKNKMVTKV